MLFCWWFMEKTIKNKLKDYKRKKGKKWVDIPTSIKERNCGSGMKFSGKYVDE